MLLLIKALAGATSGVPRTILGTTEVGTALGWRDCNVYFPIYQLAPC